MPYVIVVYDFSANRTEKPRKFLRRYLNHVQNSVFEGEVTPGQFEEIREQVQKMRQDGEKVAVYKMYEPGLERFVYGEDPAEDDQFI